MDYKPGTADNSNELAEIITSNIQKITKHSSEIQRIVNQLGTSFDTPELRHQLQQKKQLTNQLAKETERRLKEFASLPSTSEQRQRKLLKDRLLNEFTTGLTNFQKIQRQAADKEKDLVARARASSRASVGLPEDPSTEGTLVSWDNEIQPQAQTQYDDITEDDLQLIEERETAIRQLEADILNINEIFKDLGTMIHEQGDMIDSIEANVESADVHVQQANQQLARASEYQSKSRKKICILIVVLVVVVVAIALIIWGTTKS
ncbi:syntaxin-7 [Ambystoma mexicanum]|uniref:syntaxin-7 n=1 Tax=Ambystoma mexicanum TaxID=8296 RepID=UPI0037E88838